MGHKVGLGMKSTSSLVCSGTWSGGALGVSPSTGCKVNYRTGGVLGLFWMHGADVGAWVGTVCVCGWCGAGWMLPGTWMGAVWGVVCGEVVRNRCVLCGVWMG